MDEIQIKFKPQNYAIKGIFSKNEKINTQRSLMKKVIILLTLALNTIIFFFRFYSKKQMINNLLKLCVRKLEDDVSKDDLISEDSDIDTDIDTDIDPTDYNTQYNTYDTTTDYITQYDTYDTTQDTLPDTSQLNIYDASKGIMPNISQVDTYDTSQDIYNTEFPTENNITNKIFNNCTVIKFFVYPCDPNITNKEEENEFINDIIEQIKENKFKDLFNKTIEEDINFIKD